MDEKRRVPRKRVLMEGRIVFNNRASVISCTVRNLSATGAQITFPEAHRIPPEVELEIPKTGQWFRAHVVRSVGHSHGLMFINNAHVKPRLVAIPPRTGSTAAASLDIQKVIFEARHQIARLARVSPDAVKLRLEIDY